MMKPSGRDERAARGTTGRSRDGGVRFNGGRAQRIQAVDRAIELLKAVAGAERPPTAGDLARGCGLNRTTAWRLLATLEEHGLVERDAAQRYGIGYGTVALGQSPSGSAALVRVARPALERLAEETGATVTLSVARQPGVVAIDQIDPPDATLALNYLTKPLPPNATSNGKVFLASLHDEDLDEMLVTPLEQRTPATVTDPVRLREILDGVRREGYAVTIGELDVGVNGVSVGVIDHQDVLVAMLSVSDADHRLPPEGLKTSVPALRRAARAIQRRLLDLG